MVPKVIHNIQGFVQITNSTRPAVAKPAIMCTKSLRIIFGLIVGINKVKYFHTINFSFMSFLYTTQ